MGSSNTLPRYLTLLPAVVLFLALTLIPLVNLLVLSFNEITWAQRTANWQWIGLNNYARLGRDTLFKAGIINTVIFAIVAVAVQMVVGFWLALLTTKIKTGQLFYRTIFILPILVPGIIIGAIWKLMYSYDFGIINEGFMLLGLTPIDWLGDPRFALMSVIVVDVWHWTPFCYLLLLASMQSLPTDIYEAAEVEGASGWDTLRYITLPLMIPAIIVIFIFRMILAFKVFDEVYLLTGGGPGTSTEVISFTIYRRFFTEDQAGYGAAMSIATIFVVTLMIVIASRMNKSKGGDL